MSVRTLDDALENRDRLTRRYKAAKRAEWKYMCGDPVYGSRLHTFDKAIRFFGIEDGDAMLSYVERECHDWLGNAPLNIRQNVLERIDNRCIAIREQNGLPSFHDPADPNETNVFIECKRMLGL